MPLSEYVPDQVWLKEYPIHFAGCDFNSRMSVVRISDTELLIILSHGDLIESNAKERALEAWDKLLSASA